VAIVGGFTFYAVGRAAGPPALAHRAACAANSRVARRQSDFEGYRKLEAGLFDEMRAKIARWNTATKRSSTAASTRRARPAG
jgi:hypothetical protein